MAQINALAEAKRNNIEVANLNDSQLYLSRNGRELRDAAREAIETPIICTAAEFGCRFGHLFPADRNWSHVADHDADEIFVWSFSVGAAPLHGSNRRPINATAITTIA